MNRYQRRWISAALLAVMWIALGCNGLKAESTDDPPADATPHAVRLGYAGLYDVVNRNQGVDKLLMLKSVPEAVDAEIGRIAETCGEATDQLNDFAEADPTLKLTERGLPRLEADAQAKIEEQTRQRLLFGSGETMVTHLLLSQIKAMQYCRSMCEVLADQDARDDRGAKLKELAKRFGEHEAALLKMVGPVGAAAESDE